MLANLQRATMMTPSEQPIQAALLEAHWHSTSSEDDSRSEHELNRSAPIETYDSTDGVCNGLARIAMNRSAVMQAYDSMFPRPATRGGSRRGWLHRTLDLMFGRTAP